MTDSASPGRRVESLFSLRDLFTLLFRYKTTIFLMSLATLVAVLAGLWLWPPAYEAKAALLVKLGRENLADPGLGPSSRQLVTTGLRNEDINSEIRMLTSRSIVEQVVASFGPDGLPAPPRPASAAFTDRLRRRVDLLRTQGEHLLHTWDLLPQLTPGQEAVLKIRKKLTVKRLRESDVIELQLRWPEPEVARQILDRMLAHYLEVHLRAHRTRGDYAFFEEQVFLARDRLTESEEDLDQLKELNRITAYEEQQKRLLENTMAFDALSRTAHTDLAESQARQTGLTEQMDALRECRPAGFQALMTEAEHALFNERVQSDALTQRIVSIDGQLADYHRELARLERCEIPLRRLARQIEIDEENYTLYSKKLEEARISAAQDNSQIVNVRIIEPSTVSFRPVSPSRLTLLLVGLLLGPLTGLGCALVLDYLDHSIKTHEDVTHYMDLPLLTSVQEARRCTLRTIMKS